MPMRHGSDQAMAAFGPAIAPHHVGLHRAFINENQLRRGQFGLLLAPFNACLGNILALLLGRVEGLFLESQIKRGSVLLISPVLAETWCVSSSQARNSAIVASGRALTCASIAGCSPLNLGTTWQRCGRASVCPVSLRRDRTLET